MEKVIGKDGCDEYLRKPISRTDLRTVLDRFLQETSEAETSAEARPAVVKAAKNGSKPPESQIEKAS